MKRHARRGKRSRAALLAVDHDQRAQHLRAGFAEHLDGSQRSAGGRHYVLHEHHAIAGLKRAFDPFQRAVVLGLFDPHDQRRHSRVQREGRDQRHSPKHRASQALHAVRQSRCHLGGDAPQQLGPRREQILIEVVVAASARAQKEIAPQQRRGDQIPPKHLVGLAHSPPRAE